MALDLGEIGYETYINDKKYEKGLRKMERGAERTSGNIVKTLAKVVSVFAAWNIGKMLIRKGSDLEEAENKFRVVFQSIGDSAEKARKRLEKAFGRSKQESAELLGDAGDILTGLEFDPEIALKMSQQAAELGVDLTSLQNFKGGAKAATIALTKAMLGETESAKALGIVIRQDSEEYKNLVKHYMTTEKMTLLQAKAQTALDIAMMQSKNAVGDYARTYYQFANSLRRFGGQMDDVTAKLGQNLIPMASKILGIASWGIKILGGINGKLVNTIAYFGMWAVSMYGLMKVLKVMENLKGAITNAAVNAGLITKEAALAKQAEAAKVAANRQSNAIRIAQNKKRAMDEAVNYKSEQKAAYEAEKNKSKDFTLNSTQSLKHKEKLKTAEHSYRKSLKASTSAKHRYKRAQLAANIASAKATAITTTNTVATATNTGATTKNTVATVTNVVATTALGKAKIFATVACKGLWAVLVANPLTAIIAVIGLLVAGINAWSDSIQKAAQKQVEATTKATNAAAKALELTNKQHLADLESIDRLKKLAKVERLSNEEKAEAKELIEDLTKKYGKLGISINETTDKLDIQSGAFEKNNKKMLKNRNAKIKAEKSTIVAEIKARKNKVNKLKGGISTVEWLSGEEEKRDEAVKVEFAAIDALYEKLYVLKRIEKSNKAISDAEIEARKKARRNAIYTKTEKEHDAYTVQKEKWANDRLSDYERELKAINKIVDAQKERIGVLKKLGRFKTDEAKASLKLAEDERKRRTDQLRDKYIAEQKAEEIREQSEQARKQAQDAELSRDLEYNQLKAKYLADGKLDKQENISLAQKEVELQRQRVAEAKKLAEEAKAANKAQAKNALAQAKIEFGEMIGDLNELKNNPAKTKRDIAKTGGFLATRVSLIGDQNPEKETAKNTKEMVKHTKNTEKYTKKIAEKEDLTFD